MAKAITEDEYNELVEENNLLKRDNRAKDESIKQLVAVNAERKDDSWFQREIEAEKKKTAKAEARIKTLADKARKDEAERELNAADAKRIEDERIAEIRNNTKVSQDEHSRYRVLDRAPGGQRDIFGDPTSVVFDLAVEFSGYYGGVYLPVISVIEMAQSIGMLTVEDSDTLKAHSLNSELKANVAPEAAKELQDGIDSLISEFNARLDSATAGAPVDSESESGDDGESDSDSGQANGTKSDGKPGAVPANSNDTKLGLGKGSDTIF